jgi:Rrf2 family protein
MGANDMKLSTKGRYGVRLMLDLALHYGQGTVFLRDVAKRQEISEKYLWQLTGPLKAARLIRSTRGPHGGYALAKPPQDINLREIVNILEGPLCIVDCVDDPGLCDRALACHARRIWSIISMRILDVLESTTLQDMLEGNNGDISDKGEIH